MTSVAADPTSEEDAPESFLGGMDGFPPGSVRGLRIGGRSLAVVRTPDGAFYACEDVCPHKGGAFSQGTLHGEGSPQIECPLHGWKFDLSTGAGEGRPWAQVAMFRVSVREQRVFVRIPATLPSDQVSATPSPDRHAARAPIDDGIHRVLVRYGCPGWVQCFGTIENLDLKQGHKILIATHRGEEAGEVLLPSGSTLADSQQPTGEILRRLTDDEWNDWQQRRPAEKILADAVELIAADDLALDAIDAETLHDGQSVVVYYVGEPSTELGPASVELSRRHGVGVIFESWFDLPTSGGGCGSGGCGSGGCHS